MTTSDRLYGLRRAAWCFGCSERDALLAQYAREYGESIPPPAKIGSELLTDFLGARLAYDALPLNLFARTIWDDGQALVTVNSRTSEIEGVKDAEGVANVAIWHEIMHVLRDVPALRDGSQTLFDRMGPLRTIACYRGLRGGRLAGTEFRREFFAEEAGRAAAVSFPHLLQAESFRDFLDLANRGRAHRPAAWHLLYRAAEAIGVNISALINQLEAQGLLVVDRSGERPVLSPQPGLRERFLTGVPR